MGVLSGIGFELELILLQPAKASVKLMVIESLKVESARIINILISFLSFIFALNASFKQKANVLFVF